MTLYQIINEIKEKNDEIKFSDLVNARYFSLNNLLNYLENEYNLNKNYVYNFFIFLLVDDYKKDKDIKINFNNSKILNELFYKIFNIYEDSYIPNILIKHDFYSQIYNFAKDNIYILDSLILTNAKEYIDKNEEDIIYSLILDNFKYIISIIMELNIEIITNENIFKTNRILRLYKELCQKKRRYGYENL